MGIAGARGLPYCSPRMGKRITIYADEGAGDFSLFCARAFFEEADITLCKAADILSGQALAQCDLFIMPGGGDLPYCRDLNGAGTAHLRDYVESGGTYLGICAGAYFGCRDIAYHAGRADEISGPRELALIDATAHGSLPALAGYYDATLNTATWAQLITHDNQSVCSFYNGGCAFDVRDPDADIIARFTDLPGQPPAIIAKQIGQGRAILSGVHIEARPHHFSGWQWTKAGEPKQAIKFCQFSGPFFDFSVFE